MTDFWFGCFAALSAYYLLNAVASLFKLGNTIEITPAYFAVDLILSLLTALFATLTWTDVIL